VLEFAGRLRSDRQLAFEAWIDAAGFREAKCTWYGYVSGEAVQHAPWALDLFDVQLQHDPVLAFHAVQALGRCGTRDVDFAQMSELRGIEHDSAVLCACATGANRLAMGCGDGSILHDLTTDDESASKLLGHKKDVCCLCLLSEEVLASGSLDNTVRVWSLRSQEVLQVLSGHTHWVLGLARLSDTQLASASRDKTIRLWNLAKAEEDYRVLQGHAGPVICLCRTTASSLVSGSSDRTLRVWSSDTGEELRQLHGHTDGVRCLCQASAELLASGSVDKTVRLWDLTSWTTVRVLEGFTGSVRSLCLLAPNHLAAADGKGRLIVRAVQSGEKVHDVKSAHSEPIGALTVAKVGGEHVLCSGSADSTLKLWQLQVWGIRGFSKDPNELRSIKHDSEVRCACTTGASNMAVGCSDGSIRLHDLTTDDESVSKLLGHEQAVCCLCLLCEEVLASGSEDNTVRVWSLRSQEVLQVLSGHTDWVQGLARLSDTQLAGASVDGTIRLWNLAEAEEDYRVLQGHSGIVFCLCRTAAGSLVSGSSDRTLRVWNCDTGEELQELRGHTSNVNCLCQASAELLASGSLDKTVRLWDLTSWTTVRVLEGLTAHVSSLCLLAPNHLAAADGNGRLCVWCVDSGEPVHELKSAHSNTIRALTVAKVRGEHMLCSGSSDSTLKLWQLQDSACGHEEQVLNLQWTDRFIDTALPSACAVTAARAAPGWIGSEWELFARASGAILRVDEMAQLFHVFSWWLEVTSFEGSEMLCWQLWASLRLRCCPNPPALLPSIRKPRRPAQAEASRHQLAAKVACGKLRLRRHVEGLGGVFAVAKKGGRQRKIWDGSKVSESAAVPPKPRRLANPSSFLDLQIDPGAPVFFSKRDASTFFDTLKVPPALQTWFGQPPITMQEFQQHGLEGEALRIACDDCDHNNLGLAELLFPVHAVWPMGFSWSSAVAQDTTLATCVAAGIAEEHILSLDHDIPQCHDEVCFVATDDTVLVHTDARKGRDTLANLDRAFESHGIPRNASKDISLAPELTALGCDLSNNPVKAEPNSEKMGQCICRTLDLLHRTHASPRAVHGLLGVWEWFALLQRGFFSIYDSVYQFVRKEPADCVFPVPGAVLNEMLVSALLAPLLSADLDRLVLPKLVATDAAPEFGFGVSACECNIREATQVCRLSERRGDYVRLTSHPGDVAEMPRLGVPRKLGCTQKDFVTIICSKAKWPAHSGETDPLAVARPGYMQSQLIYMYSALPSPLSHWPPKLSLEQATQTTLSRVVRRDLDTASCSSGLQAKPSAGVGEIDLHFAMAEARALLDSEQPDRPRSLVATLVCPQPHKLMDGHGRLQLAEHVREHFLRVTDLEIDLGISKQTLRLAPAQESCRDDVEQGRLPTLQRQLVVPAAARVLGFKYHEAVEQETGFARVHALCVLLEEEGKLYLEPLSRIYIDQLSRYVPGRVRWLPPALEKKMGKEGLDVTELPEVDGLQILPASMDHIVDARYKDPWKALSFSKVMWWVDLSLLTCALFYIDIVLDIKQLALFYGSGLHGYLLLNMFVGTRSPDLDAMTFWIPPGILLPLLVIATISQTLMLLLSLVSAATGKKHPLLSGAKFAEVAESATSALVQTNFLISALGGVSQIQALELSEEQLQSMQLSVAVSCLSLGLGFASRDKADSAVLGLPGKLGWDATMAALVLTRSMEVSSRVFAYNILQVSVRGWPLLRFGSLVAVGLVLVSARLLFPDASLADVAASTIAHPGQILEPSSLLPLQHSLCLHGLIVAAAGGSQLLLHTSAAPDASKMLPSALLIAWLVGHLDQTREGCNNDGADTVSIASWAALVLLRMRGTYVDQPRFVALASAGDRSIPFSTLAPAFGSSGQVPKAVFKAMKAKHPLKLDTKAAVQGLDEKTLRMILNSGVGVQLAPIALEVSGLSLVALIECLAASTPESLQLHGFRDIAGVPWQLLGGAEWPQLKKADLAECFEENGEGAEGLLGALARCRELQELNMVGCQKVPAAAWRLLATAEWPALKKADFTGCFCENGEGAAELLGALCRCRELEELNMSRCPKVPAAAWRLLAKAEWPALKKAYFAACFHDDGEGAEELLGALGRCRELEAVDFDDCEKIPESAWAALGEGWGGRVAGSEAFKRAFHFGFPWPLGARRAGPPSAGMFGFSSFRGLGFIRLWGLGFIRL
ncbi:unnamed protein product, partial [Symbiodinium sp. KB8]